MRSRLGPGLIAAVLAGTVFSCSPAPTRSPGPTTSVAAETNAPTRTVAPAESPGESPGPEPTPPASEPPGGSIVPGSVNRTSMNVSVTYDVKTLISVGSRRVEMTTLLRLTNQSGDGIDRLDLNTVAARLGNLRITETSVDDKRVKPRVHDQTITVPLGGVLPDGASTQVRIGYRASLRGDLAKADWLFTSAGGTLALHRWIPWVSRGTPFDHGNDGFPFVTPSSRRVDIEIVTDAPMDLAAPAREITEVPAGAGRAWAFSMENVRDLSIVLAPKLDLLRGEAKGVPIRVYVRPGSPNGPRLLSLAEGAVRAITDQVGVDYPWPALSVVETQGGEGLESPGLVWIPRSKDSANRAYAVYHTIAHQWFYGIVGYDQRAQPFAGEGISDLLARTALGILRPSHCPVARLDRPITAYSDACYYEVVQVQGGLLLERVRQRMGGHFWAAVRAYLEAHRFTIGGTKQLLSALQEASPTSLESLLRPRFPSLY
jgi:hypothetical protein